MGFTTLLSLFVLSLFYVMWTIVFAMWQGNWTLHKYALVGFLTTGVSTVVTAATGTVGQLSADDTHEKSGSLQVVMEPDIVVNSARML